jgi:SAM-dependent methyltransferase
MRALLAGILLVLLGVPAHAQVPSATPAVDVPFVPSPSDAVAAMLKLAGVTKGDVVYDLGSGDGRIVITAARRYGARGVGIDIDPARVAEGERNARAAGVADRVRFLQQDLFDADVRDATVVTLYLLPRINLRLRPKLLADLRPGTRVVSYGFDMGDWAPDGSVEVGSSTVYLWLVPRPRE